MPQVGLLKKEFASIYRKTALKELREDKARVGVTKADLKARVDYLREVHLKSLGIKPIKK